MWRSRKCAETRSPLRMWRVDSRVGWRRREAIWGVREGAVGLSGGRARRAVVRRWVDMSAKEVGGDIAGAPWED